MTQRTAVVGAALVRRGRVLAARRTGSVGGWEFPGGKVEPGESAEAALVREVREELGCGVALTGWLAGESEVRPGLLLRVGIAHLVDGEPIPSEHDIVRWLRADQLDVGWLAADRPFLAELAGVLGRADPSPAPGVGAVRKD